MPSASASSTRGKTGQDDDHHLTKEETDLWASLSKELQSSSSPSDVNYGIHTRNSIQEDQGQGLHPVLALGLVGALIAHGAIIFSLPPVLRGRGAPFLPTASNGMNVMFQQLKNQPLIRKHIQRKKMGMTTSSGKIMTNSNNNSSSDGLTFVDLGSGDGRVVFRAAREGIFSKSVGYEINPVLHTWANMRRIIQAPKYLHSTNFYMQDLWKVNLSKADVVAVYGLHPIMDRLGSKMQQELKPGAIVVSNVFTIPGWRPIFSSSSQKHRVHMYSIPQSILCVTRTTDDNG